MKIVLIAVCSLVIALHGVSASVELGIDVLQKQGFAILQGKRVGLVTNQTGVNSSGTKTRAILRNAPGVKLVALFTPERGRFLIYPWQSP